MLNNSLESARFIVEWNDSEETRREVAAAAKKLLEFEPLWIMLAAHVADGILSVETDKQAIELRQTMKASGMLRARLRMLIRSVRDKNSLE